MLNQPKNMISIISVRALNRLLSLLLSWNLSLHPCKMKAYYVTKIPKQFIFLFWGNKNPLYHIRYRLSCEKIFKVLLVQPKYKEYARLLYVSCISFTLKECFPLLINSAWNTRTLTNGLYFKCKIYIWWKSWPIVQNQIGVNTI